MVVVRARCGNLSVRGGWALSTWLLREGSCRLAVPIAVAKLLRRRALPEVTCTIFLHPKFRRNFLTHIELLGWDASSGGVRLDKRWGAHRLSGSGPAAARACVSISAWRATSVALPVSRWCVCTCSRVGISCVSISSSGNIWLARGLSVGPACCCYFLGTLGDGLEHWLSGRVLNFLFVQCDWASVFARLLSGSRRAGLCGKGPTGGVRFLPVPGGQKRMRGQSRLGIRTQRIKRTRKSSQSPSRRDHGPPQLVRKRRLYSSPANRRRPSG